MSTDTTTFTVTGMTCGHCVAAVTDEVSKLDNVTRRRRRPADRRGHRRTPTVRSTRPRSQPRSTKPATRWSR